MAANGIVQEALGDLDARLGHVMPPGRAEKWLSPAFEPTERGAVSTAGAPPTTRAGSWPTWPPSACPAS